MTVADYNKLVKSGGTGKKRGEPEHDEQVALFEWANLMSNKIPELQLMFAVPNGAFYGRRWSVGVKMKAEGLKSGVPDVCFPVPNEQAHGLWMEMKVGKNKPSEKQEWWIENLREQGYQVNVCYSASEAIAVIEECLNI